MSKRKEEKREQEYYRKKIGEKLEEAYLSIPMGEPPSEETIKKWMRTFYRRFFMQQFKRSCLPDGPKVGSVTLSPRGDFRMPSDACSRIWLEEIETL